MEVYKILHKPTGLFFTPSKGHGNLSDTGKVYPRKPNLDWTGNSVKVVIKPYSNGKLTKKMKILINYFKIEPNEKSGNYWIDKCFSVSKEDWEIIKL